MYLKGRDEKDQDDLHSSWGEKKRRQKECFEAIKNTERKYEKKSSKGGVFAWYIFEEFILSSGENFHGLYCIL